VLIEGRPLPDGAARPLVDYHAASPGYFSTIGQPVLSGRAFSERDVIDTRPVVIINRTFARHFWPNEDPVGRRISGDGTNWFEIVGVVADTLARLDQPPQNAVYSPLLQGRQLSTNWLVRTDVDPRAMERQIRAALRAIDPDQPVDHFRTVADVRAASLQPPTLIATLLGLFALLALVITAAGIGGVIAFSVNQRTREFGVRMALGAGRANVLTMVLKQGLGLVLAGLAIGMAGALVLTRVLTTLLFGIEPTDALTFLMVSTVLVAVAAAACIIPARRAASIDPMVALRVT
jgi:predicted permease